MAAVAAYGDNNGGSGGGGGRGETATMALRRQGRRCQQDIDAAFVVAAVMTTAVAAAAAVVAAAAAATARATTPVSAFARAPLLPHPPSGHHRNPHCRDNKGDGRDAARPRLTPSRCAAVDRLGVPQRRGRSTRQPRRWDGVYPARGNDNGGGGGWGCTPMAGMVYTAMKAAGRVYPARGNDNGGGGGGSRRRRLGPLPQEPQEHLGGTVGGGAGGARDCGGHGRKDGEDGASYWLARELSVRQLQRRSWRGG